MPGSARYRALLASLFRRVFDVLAFWRHTPENRGPFRLLGMVMFGCMTVTVMGPLGCTSCIQSEFGTVNDPNFQAKSDEFFGGFNGAHPQAAHPMFVGSDGSQTGLAPFVGNATAITEPSSTYFVILREPDCSLALVNGTSSLMGQFTVTSSVANYEKTLHQQAGLTTAADTFSSGCVEKTTGISTRTGVYAGITSQGIAVMATAQGNGNNNALFVLTTTHNFSSVNFKPITSLQSASAVATADLNVDGNGDFVVVNSYNATSAFVSVVLGNADGTMQTPVSYPTAGAKSVAAVIDDINGDGKLDILVASDDQNISVLTGKGDGTFNAAQTFAAPLPGSATPSSTPIHGLITADVNGDGKKDIICSNGLVLLGSGTGTFTSVATPAFPYIGNTNSQDGPGLASGDVNGDGKKDLVVNDGNMVTVWLGNNDGTFTRGTSYTSIGNSGYVTLTDLDGDGSLDIYTGLADGGLYSGDDSSFAAAYVLMGRGDGTFVGAPTTSTGSYNGANLGDVNGDGVPDLVTAAVTSTNLLVPSFTVQLGNGKGEFSAASTVPSVANFTSNGYPFTAANIANSTLGGYAVADIDGDGKADLVFVCNQIPTINPGSGFGITYPYPLYFTAHSNGDGTFAAPVTHAFPQIAAASGYDNTLSVSGLQIADFNKDGKADLIFTYNDIAGGAGINPYQQGLVVLTGNGNATFSSTPVLTSTYSSTIAPNTGFVPTVLTTTDLNGDGKPDLVVNNTTFTVATGTVRQLLVYAGNGDGTFKAPTTIASADVYGIPALADFNKDGKLDLAFLSETSSSQAQLNIAPGNGDGTFGALMTSNLSGGDSIRSASVAAADFNADGKADLALLESGIASGIFYGNGAGGFSSVPLGGNIYPKDLINVYASGTAAAVDLNNDGKPDLVVGNTILINSFGTAVVPVLTATTTAVTAGPNPAVVGATVTLTATVTPASGTTAATGTVTFLDGATTLGTGMLNASNQATFTTSTLTAGPHSITAVYGGDTNYSGSTSGAVAEQIVAATAVGTTTSLSASVNPVVSGASVSFMATVTPASGSVVPTGTVTFTDGTTTLGSASLDATGKATYTTSSLSVGTHTLVATYAGVTTGNPTFSGSASAALTETVTALVASDFTLSLSPTVSTVTHGSPATTVATITPSGGFAAATSLTCSGAPANSTCSVAPTSVTPAGAPVTATVTLQTSVTTAALYQSPGAIQGAVKGSGRIIAFAGVLPLGLLGVMCFYRRRSRFAAGLLSLCCLAALVAISGCGKKNSSTTQTTATGTYPLTITAISGTISHTATYTVTVQ